MITYEVSGFPKYVDISLRCPNCNKDLEERVYIPSPDFDSEKESFDGTRNDEFYDITCTCGYSITAQTTGSISGNYIYLHDIDDDYPVQFEEESE